MGSLARCMTLAVFSALFTQPAHAQAPTEGPITRVAHGVYEVDGELKGWRETWAIPHGMPLSNTPVTRARGARTVGWLLAALGTAPEGLAVDAPTAPRPTPSAPLGGTIRPTPEPPMRLLVPASLALVACQTEPFLKADAETFELGSGDIDSTHLADGAVGTDALADGAVTRDKLAEDAVDGTILAEESVDSQHLTDASIRNEHLAWNSVGDDQILNDAVESQHIADGVVLASHIAEGAIEHAHLGLDVVDSENIADDAIDTEHLALDAVDSPYIANDAVDSEHLANDAVDSEHIANDAVDSEHVANDAIDSLHIANDAVDSEHVANDAIDSEHIAASAIDTSHIAANGVGASEVKDDSIDSDHLVDEGVKSDDLDDYIDLGVAGSKDGNLQVYDSAYSVVKVELDDDTGAGVGKVETRYGDYDEVAVRLGSSGGLAWVAVYDTNGSSKAGIKIDSSGDGEVWGTSKDFVMDHPEDPELCIVYSAIEGPESAAYVRGTATLEDGFAEVPLPDHFLHVAAAEGMTATLTPTDPSSRGLAVISLTPEALVVQELAGGRGDYEFYWQVHAVRAGREDFRVLRPRSEYESD